MSGGTTDEESTLYTTVFLSGSMMVTDLPGSNADTVPVILVDFVVVWLPDASVVCVCVSDLILPSEVTERTVIRETVTAPLSEGSVFKDTSRPTATSGGAVTVLASV